MKSIKIILIVTVGFPLGNLLGSDNYQEKYAEMVQKSNELYDFVQEVHQNAIFKDEPDPDPTNTNIKRFLNILRDEFPTKNNRIERIVERSLDKEQTKQQIVNDAQLTFPLIHPKVQTACEDFLAFKRVHGTPAEQDLYKKTDLQDFIYRLIYNRPLSFCNQWDSIFLRPTYAMKNKFKHMRYFADKNGRDDNKRDRFVIDIPNNAAGTEFIDNTTSLSTRLDDYLSYDEIPLAALLGLSGLTDFINNGNRNNQGELADPNTFQNRGVYIGLVGPRLEKENYMECKQIIVTKAQNIEKYGYGRGRNSGLIKIYSKLYDIDFLTYDEVEQEMYLNNSRFTVLQKQNILCQGHYFDIHAYKKRIAIIIENFLLDANDRAKKLGKTAYCFVIGAGLGVWQQDDRQVKWMMEAYRDFLNSHPLPYISSINFSYIAHKFSPQGVQENPYFTPNEGTVMFAQLTQNPKIRCIFTTDNPASPLPLLKRDEKLLVAMYAWDGNAYAGNEYWVGQLTASGDPAAASCSTIPELQNPLVNPFIKTNTDLVVQQIQIRENQQQQTFMAQRAAALQKQHTPPQHTPPQHTPPQHPGPTTPIQNPQLQIPQQFVANPQSNFVPPVPQNPKPNLATVPIGQKKVFGDKTAAQPTQQPTPPSGSGIWAAIQSFLSSIKSYLFNNYESY